MMRKELSVHVKDAEQGLVEAVFSTFNVVDKDGDLTLPEAIKDGAVVAISPYGHSWRYGSMPVGKGVIRNDGQTAVLEGQFFLNTESGRDHFELVKQMGDAQEWSYGFTVEASSPTKSADGDHVNTLERLTVHEVSPVLVGAGVGTRTLSAKGLRFLDESASVLYALNELIDRAASIMERRQDKGRTLGEESVDSLNQILAASDRIRDLLDAQPDDSDSRLQASVELGKQRARFLRSLLSTGD